MTKTYVLWSDKGPVATGDLDAVKARAEKMVTKAVGDTRFKWEPVEKGEDDDWTSRLRMTRMTIWDNWLKMPHFIDEVPALVAKKKAGA